MINLKRFLLSMVVILLFYMVSCNSPGEHKVGVVKTQIKVLPELIDTSAYVATVEKYSDSIDHNLSKLKMKSMDVFGASAEGGEITIYEARMDTLKIKASYYGETGKNEYNVYLRDRMVVFFKITSTFYVSPIGKKPAKIDSITHKSYALKENRVLAGINGRLKIKNSENERESNDIMVLYKEILLQLHEQ